MILAIQIKRQKLKDWAIQLDKTILDKAATDSLLRPAWNSLRDVENLLLPSALRASSPAHASMWFEMADFQLGQAEKQLQHAEDMVAKYGESLQVIG